MRAFPFNRDFIRAFASKAATDPDTGALVADVASLDAIRKTLNNKLSNANREMLNASLQALADSGMKLVFGTPDMVDLKRAGYDTYVGTNNYGKIDVENNVIYLTNPSAETLPMSFSMRPPSTRCWAFTVIPSR